MSHAQQVAPLLESARNAAPQNRVAAVKALAAIGPDAASALVELMKTGAPALRFAARESLVAFGRTAVDVLLKALPDKDCVVALRELAPGSRTELMAGLRSENPGVRAGSAWALFEVGLDDETVFAALAACLADPTPDVADEVERLVLGAWAQLFPARAPLLTPHVKGARRLTSKLREELTRGLASNGDLVRADAALALLDVSVEGAALVEHFATVGNLGAVTRLLDAGAPTGDATALALEAGHDAVALGLLEHGPSPHPQANTLLPRARSLRVVEALIAHGATVPSPEARGQLVEALRAVLVPHPERIEGLVACLDRVRAEDEPDGVATLATLRAELATARIGALERAYAARTQKPSRPPSLADFAAFAGLEVDAPRGKRAPWSELFCITDADLAVLDAGETLDAALRDLEQRDVVSSATVVFTQLATQRAQHIGLETFARLARLGLGLRVTCVQPDERDGYSTPNAPVECMPEFTLSWTGGSRALHFENDSGAEWTDRPMEVLEHWLRAGATGGHLHVTTRGDGPEYHLALTAPLVDAIARAGTALTWQLD